MAASPNPTTSGATVPTPPVFSTAKATVAKGAAATVAAQAALRGGATDKSTPTSDS